MSKSWTAKCAASRGFALQHMLSLRSVEWSTWWMCGSVVNDSWWSARRPPQCQAITRTFPCHRRSCSRVAVIQFVPPLLLLPVHRCTFQSTLPFPQRSTRQWRTTSTAYTLSMRHLASIQTNCSEYFLHINSTTAYTTHSDLSWFILICKFINISLPCYTAMYKLCMLYSIKRLFKIKLKCIY